jgi:hypothetical protein
MDFFTSITANYLPKARVLARSVKRHHPDARFHLVLCDEPPAGFGPGEPFDAVLTMADLALPVPHLESWIFKHTLVELCTAVKGQAFCRLFETTQAEKLVYLDPDIAVFAALDALAALLDTHAIVVTPHLTMPEETLEAVLDNEISTLRHGIYNMGFLAVRRCAEGQRFLGWWRDRLLNFCYDDIPNGLFTDQKWIDLAPALFEVHILKDPTYNVATWNIAHRPLALAPDGAPTLFGEPLKFFHFSGFDSGAHAVMRDKYGGGNAALRHLSDWYVRAIAQEGQTGLGDQPWAYGAFSNGVPIERRHRLLYRSRPDAMRAFTHPSVVTGDHRCFYSWFQAEEAHTPAIAAVGPTAPAWIKRRLPLPLKLALKRLISRVTRP